MFRADHLWWATATGFVATLLVTLCISVFDQRSIGNQAAWIKPIKFQISLAFHFATLAAITGLLSEQQRTGSVLFWFAVVSIGSAVFEIAYIMVQAARQQASHFNLSTPLYQTMYVLMAIGAVFITVAAAAVGAAAWFDSDAELGPATRLAIAVGLTGGTVLTLVIAFRLGGALNHHVGIEPAGVARFPFTGWSMSAGDLRDPALLCDAYDADDSAGRVGGGPGVPHPGGHYRRMAGCNCLDRADAMAVSTSSRGRSAA